MNKVDPLVRILGAPGIIAGLRASIAAENHAQRAPLRQRLESLELAARLIEKEMTDPAVLSQLLMNGDVWIENESAIVRGVDDIARRAHEAAAKLHGRGRARAYSRAEGLTPMMQCALIVSVACDHWPGKDNAQAQAACVKVWKAAGGRGRSQPATWRDHLRDTRRLEGGVEARAIDRALRKLPEAKAIYPTLRKLPGANSV